MTYFSIQKKLNFWLLAACFIVSFGLGAHAQQEDLQTKIIEAQDQIKAERDKKFSEENANKTNAPIVVELFTSPDCSACIYADRMLYDAMKNPNVIALSCYIYDWEKDKNNREIVNRPQNPGAIDQCVFRQWTYLTGHRSEYGYLPTPEFIIGGDTRIVSSSLSMFAASVEQKKIKFNNTTLDIGVEWKNESTLTILLPEKIIPDYTSINASIYLVRYKNIAIEKVEKGVNKGRVLRFSNVIQDIKHIAKWQGHSRSIDVVVPKPTGGDESGGYVVLAQEMLGEQILAAGKISDYPAANDKKQTSPQSKK